MEQKRGSSAAKNFSLRWKNKGYEKGQAQNFWRDLLYYVFEVKNISDYIEFEPRINGGFIDAYIEKTKVLIEQKSSNVNLEKPSTLELVFSQAKKYSDDLPYSKKPKWIIVCNFKSFFIYNMDFPNKEPEKILLKDLETEYYRLSFLVDKETQSATKEETVSFKAGNLVKKIYDAFFKEYKNIESEKSKDDLNELCTRLVFCLYAEDSGLFYKKDAFCNYLAKSVDTFQMRQNLITAFKVLNTKPKERDPYLGEDLLNFPYVNGGLFSNENIEIPNFTEEIKNALIKKASKGLDWSKINPTIFGAIFESTLNPETRKIGGMHYTSTENIHKVIDPLFLNDLKQKLADLKQIKDARTKTKKLLEFQNHISTLTFFDPACGCGNFLTETYTSLRKVENQILNILIHENVPVNQIKIRVGIDQFYGIEINDFATQVAKTALWIAESQMFSETEKLLPYSSQIKYFLPLETNNNIITANALRMDWNELLPNKRCSYIISNPPFLGAMRMTIEQKKEIREIFKKVNGAGEFDYVTAWYKKSCDYIGNLNIKTAFVSTNSLCQGEHVTNFWKHLLKTYPVEIDFAYKTFIWNSESKNCSNVHCVIVGFSRKCPNKKKILYENNKNFKECNNINPYLVDAPTEFISARSSPICDVPKMKFGNMPRDGGNLILTPEEKDLFIKKEPITKKYIRPYIGAKEFINGIKRYCLWLKDAALNEIAKSKLILKRLIAVKKFREDSRAAGTRKYASVPALFCQITQPKTDYILVPSVTTSKRNFVPIGFMNKNVIASNLVFSIESTSLFHFGVINSSPHVDWMAAICGRLGNAYRYSKDIVYNTFPWPNPTKKQKENIEKTAKMILEARKLYPNCTLAQLYDPLTMPPELRKAHKLNDEAVLKAYGFSKNITEEECVAKLMEMYKELVEKESKKDIKKVIIYAFSACTGYLKVA